MPTIHPTAIVSKESELADDVQIGPFCVLQGRVRLGHGCHLISHVSLMGPITIGERATIYPGARLGFPGQDFKFKLGDPTAGVAIGNNAIIRENVTIHAATSDRAPTSVGNDALLMVNAHMGHDSQIGNNVILVNNCALAGHTKLFDRVTFGACSVIHQFDRVGRLAFVSGGAVVATDVPPFCMAHSRNRLAGLNLVGLRRNAVPAQQITLLRRAYRDVFRANLPKHEMVAALRARAEACPLAAEMADFIELAKRPIMRHFDRSSSSDEDSEVAV